LTRPQSAAVLRTKSAKKPERVLNYEKGVDTRMIQKKSVFDDFNRQLREIGGVEGRNMLPTAQSMQKLMGAATTGMPPLPPMKKKGSVVDNSSK
jgi:hypothetical protein